MNHVPHNLKAYLLCRYADQSSLYGSWIGRLPYETGVVTDDPSHWQVPDDAGIVITHEHFRWEEVSALRRISEQARIPTLVIADGILEYRNTWQNPTIPDAAIYQPLMSDKIACIGNNSARLIASWGNAGKVEVVGLPRLDSMLWADRGSKNSDEFVVLVATATTPAFTRQQRETVVASLAAIKSWAQAKGSVAGRPLKIRWRLTDGVDRDLGLQTTQTESSLQEEWKAVDAAVTTPSTIFLESLLARVPTAILDFGNSPAFVPSAWMISADVHIDGVMRELASPPEPKRLFQDFILHDNLSCRTPATDRMIELVTKMIEMGRDCRNALQPLAFPAQILSPTVTSQAEDLNLPRLFPDNRAFQINQVARLQAELSQAVARLSSMPQELADKNNQISQLQVALDESRRRVADVRSRLFKLRKILGIGKENQND